MSARLGGARSVMFYCPGTLGVGHVRRALAIGEYLRARWPALARLLVASLAPRSLTLPEDVELIKLPSTSRVGPEWEPGARVPRVLPITLDELVAMRREMLLAVVRHFRPDVLIVDHMPTGLRGELTPALRFLKDAAPRTSLVFGVRDIFWEGPRLRQVWERDGAYELLDEVYDRILVYGQPDVYDLVGEAGLPPRAAAKVRYVGYLRRGPGARPPPQVRAELGLRTGRLVLVTVGGGADGYPLLRRVLEALGRPEAARFDWLLVGGPLMPSEDRRRLRELVPTGVPARFLDHVEDLVEYVAAADAVVARAGYNTVCEILSLGRPAILVPRVELGGAAFHAEQGLRAEALSRRGLARMVRPADLTPNRLFEALDDLLARPPGPNEPLDFDGLPRLAAELEALLALPAPDADEPNAAR